MLTVHHALNLPAQHKDATISAYVKVTLGRTKVHTAVVTAVQPSWEAEVRLPLHSAEVVHPQSTILKVRVKRYKKGNIFGNEAVGDADVALSQLIDPKASNDGQFHVTNIRVGHHSAPLSPASAAPRCCRRADPLAVPLCGAVSWITAR